IVAATNNEGTTSVASAPDDHFSASPHCRVRVSASGRVEGAGSHPTVGAGIISPAGVQITAVISAPDDHFIASPHRSVNFPGIGRVGGAGDCPTVGDGMISAASIEISVNINSTPDDH